MAISLILNGKPTTLDAPGAARLLDVLREQGHLTSVKEGCGEGECGACTILINGEAVCSCLLMAGQVEGIKIETVEALSQESHPLLDTVVEAAGVQCGFCTPGIVLSSKALLDWNKKPTRRDIQEALSGNLCRCTGYHKIIDAVEELAHGKKSEDKKRSSK